MRIRPTKRFQKAGEHSTLAVLLELELGDRRERRVDRVRRALGSPALLRPLSAPNKPRVLCESPPSVLREQERWSYEHTPSVHELPLGQRFSQAPQCVSLVSVLVQVVPHSFCPAGHVAWHTESIQSCPPGQAWKQAPQ